MDPEKPVESVDAVVTKDWQDIVKHYFESQKDLILVLENIFSRLNKLES